MGNITMQNYSVWFPIVMLKHLEREMARNGQHYDAKLLCKFSNSDAGTFGEREMARNGQHHDAKLLCTVSNNDVGKFRERETARNGQHYDAKLLCTVSNSDVKTFGERDGQEWATLRCKITLQVFQ